MEEIEIFKKELPAAVLLDVKIARYGWYPDTAAIEEN